MRPTDSDLNMLRDVFVKKSYDLNKYTQLNRITNTYKSILKAGGVPVIIDAGANIGAVSIQLSKIFPEAKIIAVEPDTQNADICRRNCKQCENVIVVEATIGSVSGGVKLKRPDRNKSSCSIQAERGEGADIPVVTVDELLAKAGIGGKLFIIKIDIEGFEKDLSARRPRGCQRLQLSLLNYMIGCCLVSIVVCRFKKQCCRIIPKF